MLYLPIPAAWELSNGTLAEFFAMLAGGIIFWIPFWLAWWLSDGFRNVQIGYLPLYLNTETGQIQGYDEGGCKRVPIN